MRRTFQLGTDPKVTPNRTPREACRRKGSSRNREQSGNLAKMPGKSASMMKELLFEHDSPAAAWFAKASELTALSPCTSPVAKVDHFLGLLPELQIVLSKSNKSLEKALQFKEEGNALYKEGKYREARDAYTRSVQLFPVNYDRPEENREFAIVLANRSAALDAGRNYAACRQDIELAFKYGYPKTLHFKIYLRLGHALLKQRQFLKSKEAFSKCLDMIGKSDLPSKQRDQIRARTKKQMTVFNVTKKLQNASLDDKPFVELAGGANAEAPALSAKVIVTEGQAPKADTVINAGDVILRERFAVAVLETSNDLEKRFCPHTLERMAAPVPCIYGSEVMFASEKARDDANASYHAHEWRLAGELRRAGFSTVAMLALRLSLVADKVKKNSLLSIAKSCEGDEAAILAAFFFKQLCRVGFIDPEDKRAAADLKDALVRSVVVASKCATPVKIPNMPTNRDQLFSLDNFPKVTIGMGIFPTLVRLSGNDGRGDENKSRERYCLSFTKNSHHVVQMFRNIDVGEEFYVDGKEDMVDVGDDLITFRCSNQNCRTGFPLKENTREKLITCPMEGCGQQTNIWLKLKRIQELKQSYSVVKHSLRTKDDNDNLKENIRGLKHLVAEWEKVVVRPYKDISALEKDLRIALQLLHHLEEQAWYREHN